MKLLIAGLFVCVWANGANGSILCEYAAYTPSSLRLFFQDELAQQGYAAIPGDRLRIPGSSLTDLVVLRDSHQYGSLKLIDNFGGGKSALSITNGAGQQIGRTEEDIYVCREGLCRESILIIAIDGQDIELGVRDDRGLTHFVRTDSGEEELNVTVWRSQFDEFTRWILRNAVDESLSTPLNQDNLTADFSITLYSDPDIAPYMSLLSLAVDRYGRLVLSGRTNHQIYDLIIARAIASGHYNIVPDVIIDSGIFYFGPEPSVDLARCL